MMFNPRDRLAATFSVGVEQEDRPEKGVQDPMTVIYLGKCSLPNVRVALLGLLRKQEILYA